MNEIADMPIKEEGGFEAHSEQTKFFPAYQPSLQEFSHLFVFRLVYFFLSHSKEHVFAV